MATLTLARPSRRLLACFRFYLRWYVGRHFRALRLANGHRFPSTKGPLIIYSNHASWWDPLTFLIVSHHFFPDADHYAPMDATALQHYGVMRKLGMFPVENGTPRGAAQFFRAAREIFARPGSVLWLTPQGRFTDIRTRPAVFRPGMAAMIERLGTCTFLPLAAEYTFWNERLPEILMSCGDPVHISHGSQHTTEEWSEILGSALARTQDELVELSKLRSPADFHTVHAGRLGISGIYGGWQRLRARLAGRAYQPSHAQAVIKAVDE